MEAVVVTLRARKPVEHQGHVLFINAVNEVAREHAQSFLRESHQVKILDAYRGFADVEHFAAVATLDQIADKGHSLAIPLYVTGPKAADTGKQISVADAVAIWRDAASASEAVMADVLALMGKEVTV